MFGIHSKKDLRKILCLPLGVFGIVYALFQIGYGIAQLTYGVINWNENAQTTSWINAIINGILILFGVLGFIAIITRWSTGISFFMIVIKITIALLVMTLVLNWVLAICAWTGVKSSEIKEMTTTKTVALIIISLVIVIGILLCWLALSCFASLQKILQEGGSGFEKKNYKQIRAERTGQSGTHQTNHPGTSSDEDV